MINKNDIAKQSLLLHKKHQGKLETKSKVPTDTADDLTLAYSPGVGAVAKAIYDDKTLAYDYTNKGNSVAIISDGSAVLGFGNLGSHAAYPVMEGKAILFKNFGAIDAFPLCLDTQDTEEIIRTVKILAPNYGGINLEDISAPRCFEIERRLKVELDIPVMHDDQHGTAVVVLAGLINSFKLKKSNLYKANIVINGAGAAGLAIADLLKIYGCENIFLCDSKGLIHSERTDLNSEKKKFAVKLNDGANTKPDLNYALTKADVFIGVSVANALMPEMIEGCMNSEPIIFALANPSPEIMPDEAKKAGAFIVATGRSDFPNQINNVLAFPGIFRGALDNRINNITDQMLIAAAKNLAAMHSQLSRESILPSPLDKNVAAQVAAAIK